MTTSSLGMQAGHASRAGWEGVAICERGENIGQSGKEEASQGLVGVNACGSVNLLHGSLVLKGVSGGHSVDSSASLGHFNTWLSFQV